ncbi:hypothetical protein [Actinomadura atramentaria]|uniref:hypothetical protein n=1 Tax=Actinomadura atramentaria TaxID=1990 RepID=UPI00035C511C|nr:hypothetical protein [Actinomadura atramentaria]
MAETPQDPAGTTHQFQRFAQSGTPDRSGRVNPALVIGAVVVLAVLVVVGLAVVMIA